MLLAVGFMIAVASIFPTEGCECTFPNRFYTGSLEILNEKEPNRNPKVYEYFGYNGTFHADLNGYYMHAVLTNEDVQGTLHIYVENYTQIICNETPETLGRCSLHVEKKHGTDPSLMFPFPNCVSDRATYDVSNDEYEYDQGSDYERFVVQSKSDGTCQPRMVSGSKSAGKRRHFVYDNLMVDKARDRSFYLDPFVKFSALDVDSYLG